MIWVFKGLKICAKVTKSVHFCKNLHFFCIFLAKNFAVSKKCCNFATSNENHPKVFAGKITKIFRIGNKKITIKFKNPFFMKDLIFNEYRGVTATLSGAIVVVLYWMLYDGCFVKPLWHVLGSVVLIAAAIIGVICFILYLEDEK